MQREAAVLMPDGMAAWIHERLPGRGMLVPATYCVTQWGGDGCAYLRTDGLAVIMSGAVQYDGKRWLHLSLSRATRLPSWEDVKQAKHTFLGADAYAVQVLPPEVLYVNINPFVLHLFSCVDGGRRSL